MSGDRRDTLRAQSKSISGLTGHADRIHILLFQCANLHFFRGILREVILDLNEEFCGLILFESIKGSFLIEKFI